jgi:hypothetical protein
MGSLSLLNTIALCLVCLTVLSSWISIASRVGHGEWFASLFSTCTLMVVCPVVPLGHAFIFPCVPFFFRFLFFFFFF